MTKTTKPKTKEETPKFKITPDILEKMLKGELKADNTAVDYLINQLMATQQQYEQLLPQVQQKEKELDKMRKALNDLAVRFDTLQIDICNLWPN